MSTLQASLSGKGQDTAAREAQALGQSVREVETWLYTTGCRGEGCLSRETLFFRDSPVPADVQSALLQLKGLLDSLVELRSAMDSIEKASFEAALDEIRSWPSPLSKERQRVLASWKEHTKLLTSLEAYIRLKKGTAGLDSVTIGHIASAMRDAL